MLVSKICIICSKEFIPSHDKSQIYCSKTCSGIGRKGRTLLKHSEEEKSRICTQCGKEFTAIRYQKNKKFCSNDCHNSYRRNKPNGRKGKIVRDVEYRKHCSMAQQGITDEKDWVGFVGRHKNQVVRSTANYKALRTKTMKRDGYKCLWCSSDEKLETHHIIPVKANPTLELDLDNILTLCHKCHLKVRKKELDFANFFRNVLLYSQVL